MPWIIAGTIALLIVGAYGWMTYAQSMNSVDADDLGYEVVDEHSVTLRFQVTTTHGRDIACAVEALDEEFGVVGWKIVEIIGADEHSQQVDTVIPTVGEATTGLVKSCWVA